MPPLSTTCCIAGGGPAGMMLGFLLARAGIEVIVLEKHGDFFRDFRGDTIHPSTLENFHELGLLDAFLKRPHQEVREIGGQIGDTTLTVADFTHLPTRCKFIAFMPQWDFLDFLAAEARKRATFKLLMETEALSLIETAGRVTGVRAKGPDGEIEINAKLVVAADGRHSTLRAASKLEVMDFGAPIDVLWLRLSKRPGDPGQSLGRVDAGKIFIMLDRGDYWQCAFVIAKDSLPKLRERGLKAFQDGIAELVPVLRDRVQELSDWDQIKLLSVAVDRLKRWHRPGLLCIGDAAHAMSPIGGVGINLAIQDAVAAANILAVPLSEGRADDADLQRVQQRRELPTRITQAVQVFAQTRILASVLVAQGKLRPPFVLRLLQRWPYLRRIPARFVGLGFRPACERGMWGHDEDFIGARRVRLTARGLRHRRRVPLFQT